MCCRQSKIYEVVGGQNVTLTLADGKTVEAVPIILKSIRVGDFTVRNVESVICGTSYGDISEGLLGMTFLNNFMMKIDSQGRKVILEEFRPAIDG
jgi:predicted aspartyl protease